MTDDQIRDAVKWFIERFIHTEPGRIFALTMHGFIQRDSKMHPRVHRHNAKYNFVVNLQRSAYGDAQLHVIPAQPEASWCSGYIFMDSKGSFQFTTITPRSLL